MTESWAKTCESVESDPVGMDFATRGTLNSEGIVKWIIRGIVRPQIGDTAIDCENLDQTNLNGVIEPF